MPGTIANLKYMNMMHINAHSSMERQAQSQGNVSINNGKYIQAVGVV